MGKRRLSDVQVSEITSLRESGISCRAIAVRFGVSESAVWWRCLQAGADPVGLEGVPVRSVDLPAVYQRGGRTVRRFSDAEDARLLELEAQNLTYAEIGRLLERKRHVVEARLAILARRQLRAEARS